MQDKVNKAELMPLADVCRRLRVSYSRIWAALTIGAFAAERNGTRWFVRQADLPWIAAELGVDLDGGDELEGGGMVAGRRCDGPTRR